MAGMDIQAVLKCGKGRCLADKLRKVAPGVVQLPKFQSS